MGRKAIFVAASGQNVGKTTICLGLISALKKQFPNLGFMKPVGQQHIEVEKGLKVDKDVILFKEHFDLPAPYEIMSPVIFPRGFTRDYLDGKIQEHALKLKIHTCFDKIAEQSDFTIVEGTGHVGVGSIVNLDNASVARELGLEAVLIVGGGLGSAFDELALNKALCDAHGIPIIGVILNKVFEEKRPMIMNYIQKALARWKIPLLACIPYNELLGTPSMEDFELLFNAPLFSGEAFHYCHFPSIRLVASSVSTFIELILPGQLIVTPATREDVVAALLERSSFSKEPQHGLILTGRHPPSPSLVKKLQKANLPALYAPFNTYEAMRMITSHTAKIRRQDTSKVQAAIRLVEAHLDLNPILS